jgi:hypothetical protein
MSIAEVRTTEDALVGGQRGVYANCDLPSGSLVVLEWPYLTWNNQKNFNDPTILLSMVELILVDDKAFSMSKDLYPLSIYSVSPEEIENLKIEYSDITALEQIVSKFSLPSIDEIYRLLLVIKHNAFSSGLYHKLCMINHSCNPNCIKFEPRQGSRGASEVWTICPVKAGEEITISYTNPVELSSPSTQEYLFKHHSFNCHCSRCCRFNDFADSVNREIFKVGGEKNDTDEKEAEELQSSFQSFLIEIESKIDISESEYPDLLQSSDSKSSTGEIFLHTPKDISETISLQQLSLQQLTEMEKKLFSLKEEGVQEMDDNIYRLKSRIYQLLSCLFLYQIENDIFSSLEKNNHKTKKPMITESQLKLLEDYLESSLFITLYQSCSYLSSSLDHPSLIMSFSDNLHGIEYLQYFMDSSHIDHLIQKFFHAHYEDGFSNEVLFHSLTSLFLCEENSDNVKSLSFKVLPVSEIMKNLKKEINRLKSLYLLANRCKPAVFVKKSVGQFFWGQLPPSST